MCWRRLPMRFPLPVAIAALALAVISTPAEARKAPRLVEFDVVASGDLLIHRSLYRAAYRAPGRYDFRPFFAQIRPIVKGAALAICHVEHPIGAGPPSTYPIFNAPPALAEAIRWTGWDVCDTASNHTTDRGHFGVVSTLRWLDRAGIRHTGSARSAAEARRTTLLRVRGVTIAFLAYAYGSNTGIPYPFDLNLISARRIKADAHRARRLGADLVIVNLHWGEEYSHAPTEEQWNLARSLLCGRVADAIVGQHVHVVQPIRGLCGRFVVFGEGNLISGQLRPDTQDGLIAVLHVRARGRSAHITGVDYVPTHVRQPDHVVEPVGFLLRRLGASGEGNRARVDELRASYGRTVSYAGRGRFIHPVPPTRLAYLPPP
jgi:poly-gamma-glutamate capsule biosynthesis protein CapA/YwtB (metallophosphatase superfamily)